VSHLAALASLAGVRQLMPFHHDPSHGDEQLDAMLAEVGERASTVEVVAGREGANFEVARG
jgi:ribonuclease BN (tRNA processing enzyme)